MIPYKKSVSVGKRSFFVLVCAAPRGRGPYTGTPNTWSHRGALQAWPGGVPVSVEYTRRPK